MATGVVICGTDEAQLVLLETSVCMFLAANYVNKHERRDVSLQFYFTKFVSVINSDDILSSQP